MKYFVASDFSLNPLCMSSRKNWMGYISVDFAFLLWNGFCKSYYIKMNVYRISFSIIRLSNPSGLCNVTYLSTWERVVHDNAALKCEAFLTL